MVAEHSVEILRASVEGDPDNWSLRRELAEAMLEAGHRDDGIRELEVAMNGAERFGDLDLASSLAEEIARLEPDVVRHHQKRVEYAFRTNDRSRLIEAYVSLADALLALGSGGQGPYGLPARPRPRARRRPRPCRNRFVCPCPTSIRFPRRR